MLHNGVWERLGQAPMHLAAACACMLLGWGLLGLIVNPSMAGPALKPVSTFRNVSASHLPRWDTYGHNMDAEAADIDRDGDLDVIVAVEWSPNLVLINDGAGHFTNETRTRFPVPKGHDSEDVGIADFDRDGDLDVLIVTEDDARNEYWLNRGNGYFDDASDRLPVEGITNGLLVADVNRDGAMDAVLGNRGQNAEALRSRARGRALVWGRCPTGYGGVHCGGIWCAHGSGRPRSTRS